MDYQNYEPGDCYAYLAIKRKTKLHLAHSVGKRIEPVCDLLICKLSTILQPPTPTDKLEIYSDGNEQYEKALLNYFRKDSLKYGQLIKIKQSGRLIHKYKKKIYGNPTHNEIETSIIESYNSALRDKISRLIRRTKCFSKKRTMYEKHLDIIQTYQNLIKTNNQKTTPMILEEKTNKIWTWNNIFNIH